MSTTPDREDQITLLLIAERLGSLQKLTDTGFTDVQRQLERVENLPERVTAVEVEQRAQGQRLGALEKTGERGVEWRRGGLPMILLTLAIVVVSLVGIFQHVH